MRVRVRVKVRDESWGGMRVRGKGRRVIRVRIKG